MKKIMFHIVALSLVAGLLFLFSGCAGGAAGDSSTNLQTSQTSSTTFPSQIDSAPQSMIQHPALPGMLSGEDEIEMAKTQAEVLTDHILYFTFNHKITLEGATQLDDESICNFIFSLCKYRDEANHPYRDCMQLIESDGLLGKTSKEDAQKIALELFGVPDWGIQDSDAYDKENECYPIPDGVGLSTSPYSLDNLTVDFVEPNRIISTFDLYEQFLYGNDDGTPLDHYGVFQMEYQWLENAAGGFLRFEGFHPKA